MLENPLDSGSTNLNVPSFSQGTFSFDGIVPGSDGNTFSFNSGNFSYDGGNFVLGEGVFSFGDQPSISNIDETSFLLNGTLIFKSETTNAISEITNPISITLPRTNIVHDVQAANPLGLELLFPDQDTSSLTLRGNFRNQVTQSTFGRQEPMAMPLSVEKVDETLKQRYQKHILSRIDAYEKQSLNRKKLHNGLQLTIFLGAAIVATIIAIPEIPKLIPAIISGIVTVATAIANYYKFGERSRDLYLTAEDLSQEYNWFNTGRNIYKDKNEKDALDLFMDRTEELIRKQTRRTLSFEKPKQE